MASRHHTLDIYGAEIYCATTNREWATLRRKLTWLSGTHDAAGTTSFAVRIPGGHGIAVPHIVFWIDAAAHRDQPSALIDTCGHEAAHAAGALLDHIGYTPVGIDEPSAYLVGWLTQWLWSQVV